MKQTKLCAAFCTMAMIISLNGCAATQTSSTGNSSDSTTSTTEKIQTESRNDISYNIVPTSETIYSEDKEDEEKKSAETINEPNSISNETSDLEITDDLSLDKLGELVEKDIEETINSLESEYNQLTLEIDSYQKYLDNTDRIEAFYENINNTNHELCLRMYEYSLKYAEFIMDNSTDKYNDMEELYDNVYDSAGDDIYDGIYDGILEDIYDFYYNGILDDAYKSADYSEWSDAHSDEYRWWNDTRSDVYGDWADYRSDVYKFCSDVRSKLWKDDTDKAEKRIQKFREKLDKLQD